MKITKTFVGKGKKETIIGDRTIGRVVYHDGKVMIYCGVTKSNDFSFLWTTTDRYYTVINVIKEIHSQMDDSESKYEAEFGDSTISIGELYTLYTQNT